MRCVHGDHNVIIEIAFHSPHFLLILLNLAAIMEVGRGVDLEKKMDASV